MAFSEKKGELREILLLRSGFILDYGPKQLDGVGLDTFRANSEWTNKPQEANVRCGTKLEFRKDLVGRCGIYCGACRLYVIKKCGGCLNLYANKEAKCPYYKCVENKGINSCGEMPRIPLREALWSNGGVHKIVLGLEKTGDKKTVDSIHDFSMHD
jgi:hypothetical protein